MRARTQRWTAPPSRDAYEIRLPWWAIALPAVAFAALLLLIAGPAEAHAATGQQPVLVHTLERIQEVLLHQLR
ncbi:hypothetical protein [Streptomyces sp. NPDC048639]|uniref:hypothetical protein n=1 Tax=Streptomyces sp. NPDC048639 TaxID=3365581 RepID=UPI00371E4A85